jgi:ornithine cyclodeaminase
MPAWSARRGVGTKLVTIFPGNARAGLPVAARPVPADGPADGRPLAVIDGGELTARRTAAAIGLASRRLSRPDSRAC